MELLHQCEETLIRGVGQLRQHGENLLNEGLSNIMDEFSQRILVHRENIHALIDDIPCGPCGDGIGGIGSQCAGNDEHFRVRLGVDFGGAHYAFTPNEGSSTLLHSGDFGFHAGLWDVSCEVAETEGRLVLTRDFPEEKTGFPGNLKATVTYTFTDANALSIHYHIESDKKSFASPTNHTYFNLAGFGMKSLPEVCRQKIEIFADS